MTREEIVACARTWIGTPFHHRERQKGKAVDCAGLVIGVSRECGLVAPDFDIPPYRMTPDGSMLQWCDRYMKRRLRDSSQLQLADIVVFASDKVPQHMGITSLYWHGGLSIIHATNVLVPPRVIESRLMFSKNLRFVAGYVLPGIE